MPPSVRRPLLGGCNLRAARAEGCRLVGGAGPPCPGAGCASPLAVSADGGTGDAAAQVGHQRPGIQHNSNWNLFILSLVNEAFLTVKYYFTLSYSVELYFLLLIFHPENRHTDLS